MKGCPGRATALIDGPPVEIMTPHNHLSEPNLKLKLNQRKNIKDEAKSRSRNNPRRMIRDANSA